MLWLMLLVPTWKGAITLKQQKLPTDINHMAYKMNIWDDILLEHYLENAPSTFNRVDVLSSKCEVGNHTQNIEKNNT